MERSPNYFSIPDEALDGHSNAYAYMRVEEFAETTVNLSVNYFAPRVVVQSHSQSAVLRRFYEQLQQHGIGSPIQNPVRRVANQLTTIQ